MGGRWFHGMLQSSVRIGACLLILAASEKKETINCSLRIFYHDRVAGASSASRLRYAFFNAGERIVPMDGFFAFHFDPVPGDIAAGFQLFRCAPHGILHENGVFVGVFRDEFFIRPLKERIDGGRT